MMSKEFLKCTRVSKKCWRLINLTAVAVLIGALGGGAFAQEARPTDDEVRERLAEGLSLAATAQAQALVQSNAVTGRTLNMGWVPVVATLNTASITINNVGQINITGTYRARQIVLQLTPVTPLVNGTPVPLGSITWNCSASGYDNLNQIPEKCRTPFTSIAIRMPEISNAQVRGALEQGLASARQAQALVEFNAARRRVLNEGWTLPPGTAVTAAITISSTGQITITGSSRANHTVLVLKPFPPLIPGTAHQGTIIWKCSSPVADKSLLPQECRDPFVSEVTSAPQRSDVQVREALQNALLLARPAQALAVANAVRGEPTAVGWVSPSTETTNSILISANGVITITGSPRANHVVLVLTPVPMLAAAPLNASAVTWKCTSNARNKSQLPVECRR